MKIKKRFLVILFIFLVYLSFIIINSDNINQLNKFNSENEVHFEQNPYEFKEIHLATGGPADKYNFKYYKVITINHTKVYGLSDHKNYPLLISIFDSDLHNKVQPDGDDIAFANDTAWLNHEIELFDQVGNGTHAQLIAWVRIPVLNVSVNTNIIMYYGNPYLTSQEKLTEVWDDNYKGVWHMNEINAIDSTSNEKNGTQYGGVSNLGGKIASANKFEREFEQFISIDNVGPEIKTIEFWMKPSNFGEIGPTETSWKNPSATGHPNNDWSNPTYAFTSDNLYSIGDPDEYQDWYNFSFNIPNGATINGIHLEIEASESSPVYGIVALSWDGGSNYITKPNRIWDVAGDNNETFGGPTDSWGRTWSSEELNNTNFRVRIQRSFQSTGTLAVDCIYIKVYYNYEFMRIMDLDGTSRIEIVEENLLTTNFPGTTTIYIDGNIQSSLTEGQWHHITITNTKGINVSNLEIGRVSTKYFDGIMDELRISDTLRNPDSFNTSLYNQNDPTSFYNISQEFNFNSDPPSYSNLTESANPLELGDTEVISINITDPSGIRQVKIEFEGDNHSMTNIGGDFWRNDSWTPDNVGDYDYMIYMEDNTGLWNSVGGLIMVEDTTSPTYFNLIEMTDPLELGDTILISINASDLSGINRTLIEFEDSNHSMVNIVGDTWEYNSWAPSTTGNYDYVIYIEDHSGLWNSTSDSILVVDKTSPTYSNLIEMVDPLELGGTILISINTSDLSGINRTLIEFEGFNHSMVNIVGDTWEYDSWTPSTTGNYDYVIYIEDHSGLWNSFSDSIEVIDTTTPTYSNLIEIVDPLELGDTITISINASDLSDINRTLIEFEGSNHSMDNIVGDTWQYDSWTPTTTGNYDYVIYIEDHSGNWNSFSDSIEVIDTTSPTYSNLIEMVDPLELGDTILISINASDLSDINRVLIEFENSNHSMINIVGETWQYNSWIPSHIGNYTYTIYIEDHSGNWNFVSNSILVVDTTSPTYSNLIESADPFLELGENIVISVDIIDFAGIYRVLIEFEGSNHSMVNIFGNTWVYDLWTPSHTGNYNYTIYMEDNNNHSNSLINNFIVQDTTRPSPPIIIQAPSSGYNITIIFDWEEEFDHSGISYFILIIDNETNPYNTPGFVFYSMITNIGPNSSYYELTENLFPGTYYYFLCQVDGEGLQSNFVVGSFTITPLNSGNRNITFLDILPYLIGSLIASVAVIVIVRRRIQHKMHPPRKKIPLKVIISHINKISPVKSTFDKEILKTVLHDKLTSKKETIDEEELENQLNEIKTLGEELFNEGAYLEAQKQFEIAEDLLLKLDKKDEAFFYSKFIATIKNLNEEREDKIENLEKEKEKNNFIKILDNYIDIIHISNKLKDFDMVEMYQAELIQLVNDGNLNISDLEHKRSNLEKQAVIELDQDLFKEAVEFFEYCEEISHVLLKLDRLEENYNIDRYKDKINEVIKKTN